MQQGTVFSAIGSGINSIISAIANVLETIVSAIVSVRRSLLHPIRLPAYLRFWFSRWSLRLLTSSLIFSVVGVAGVVPLPLLVQRRERELDGEESDGNGWPMVRLGLAQDMDMVLHINSQAMMAYDRSHSIDERWYILVLMCWESWLSATLQLKYSENWKGKHVSVL